MKMYITVSSSVVYTNSTMRQCVYSGEAKFTMIHVRLRHLLNIHKQSVSYLRSNKNKGVHHTNKTRWKKNKKDSLGLSPNPNS